jgi:hypothetical protein
VIETNQVSGGADIFHGTSDRQKGEGVVESSTKVEAALGIHRSADSCQSGGDGRRMRRLVLSDGGQGLGDQGGDVARDSELLPLVDV